MATTAVTETNTTKHEIPSLLVPLVNQKLLLPTVCVAEMTAYKIPEPGNVDMPPNWFMGFFKWRGVQVPMVSYEAINGGEVAPIQSMSQVLVLNNTGVNSSLPFICIPTLGIPRLNRVQEQEIVENKNAVTEEYAQLTVHVSGDQAVIPDISKIEQACVELLGY